MKILCVTSAKSDLGKTRLIEQLLKRLDNWAACKITTCTAGSFHVCPRGRRCGACGSLKGDYAIEADRRIICQKGKDTYRMLKAGAKAVFWIKAKPQFVRDALHKALKMLGKYDGVILEGNSPLRALRPDLSVMIMSADGEMKKSARDICKKIDIFINNVNNDKAADRILRRLG